MIDTPSTTARSRSRAILLFIVIFLAGAIFGSAMTVGLGRRVKQRADVHPAWNVDAMRRLDQRLNLTPEQRERVVPILASMTMRLRDVRQDSRRSWTSILQETRDKLRAELTPEQQAEFDKLVTRTRENFGRVLGAPPEPGRPHNPERPSPPSRPRD